MITFELCDSDDLDQHVLAYLLHLYQWLRR